MAAGGSRRTAHVADLGLSVSPAWRRRGVAGELLDAALTAAEASSIRRIAVAVIAANEPALRLFASRGFAEEGRRPGHVRIDGEAHDLVLLGRSV